MPIRGHLRLGELGWRADLARGHGRMNVGRAFAPGMRQRFVEGLDQVFTECAHGLSFRALLIADDPGHSAPLFCIQVRSGGPRIGEERMYGYVLPSVEVDDPCTASIGPARRYEPQLLAATGPGILSPARLAQ